MRAGAALALILGAATLASALEEQRLPAAPLSAQAGQNTPVEAAPQVGVQDAAPATTTEGGTEIRIPGLGKLGTLPKMDFGLELLYGAAEGKGPEAPAIDDNSDLTIRGSVKHKF
jgi:hypothetical protein